MGEMKLCSPLRLLLLLLPEEVFDPGHPEGEVDAKNAKEDVGGELPEGEAGTEHTEGDFGGPAHHCPHSIILSIPHFLGSKLLSPR